MCPSKQLNTRSVIGIRVQPRTILQCDGLARLADVPTNFDGGQKVEARPKAAMRAMEEVFAGAIGDWQTARAGRCGYYFAPAKDSIHTLPIEIFHSANGYYATLAHESIHFTGVEMRLGRYGKYSNKQEYAFEELIAEIGSCMLCAQLGLTPEFDQSAAYIEGWLKALKDDKRLIF